MASVTQLFSLILLLTILYGAIKFIQLALQKREILYGFFGLASVTLVLTMSATLIQNYVVGLNITPTIHIWGSIIAIAFVLCGLMVMIRNSKPEFARFPEPFVALPLLIIISFPFISNTIILKFWLLGIYEACALLVAVMMHAVLSRKNTAHMIILSGIALLFLAYLIYWLPIEMFDLRDLLWQAVMAIGIVITIQGYSKIESTLREQNLESY